MPIPQVPIRADRVCFCSPRAAAVVVAHTATLHLAQTTAKPVEQVLALLAATLAVAPAEHRQPPLRSVRREQQGCSLQV